MLDHMVTLSNILRIVQWFSKVAAPFYNPTSMYEAPISPHLTNTYFLFFIYFKNLFYLFIFGCVVSSLLRAGFL